MRRRPLPDSLGVYFSIDEAGRTGVPRGRLRGQDLETPFRGMRMRRPDAAIDTSLKALVIARVQAYARIAAANQFYAGASAAVLWGFPLPRAILRRVLADGVDVAVFSPAQHPRRVGVRGRRVHPASAYVVEHPAHGVRLTSPASTWAALGATLRDPYDLIAAGDAAVRERMFRDDPSPLATLDQLTAAAAAHRRIGVPALRAALPRIRTRSASPRETWCRLLLIDAGLPEPELNYEVRDAAGRVIACVDLAYPEARVAVEYEGEHHLLSPAQWARDLARHEALATAGWFVIRVSAAHLASGGTALAARVRAALTR